MDSSPDGNTGLTATSQVGCNAFASPAHCVGTTVKAYNNIYFNYSNDGGSSWLPANTAVIVNDTLTVGGGFPGRKTAFPRMAITSTDDIFITYEDDINAGTPDIRLAKMDADSLKLGTSQPVRIGASGTANSLGGVVLAIAGEVQTGPDIAVGDDDVLHVVWYDNTNDIVVHKSMPADQWTDVSAFGWNQTVDGSTVGGFVGLFTKVCMMVDYLAVITLPPWPKWVVLMRLNPGGLGASLTSPPRLAA
jgi:hypothetical protein